MSEGEMSCVIHAILRLFTHHGNIRMISGIIFMLVCHNYPQDLSTEMCEGDCIPCLNKCQKCNLLHMLKNRKRKEKK